MPISTRIHGFQIAFLTFAVALLVVPATNWISARAGAPFDDVSFTSRLLIFGVAAMALASTQSARAAVGRLLAVRVGRDNYGEVAFVTSMSIIGMFAINGALALWFWLHGGDALVQRHFGDGAAQRFDEAVSPSAVRSLPLLWIAAPIVEELVFRGFLYGAWVQRWHPAIAMLMTAGVFAFYHHVYVAAFAMSLLFNAVYVRTGSLRAAMIVHAVSNASLWVPLAGRFMWPQPGQGLPSWWLNFVCLAVFAPFLGVYWWRAVHAARSTRLPTELAAAH